jgi:hypothetical protein
MGDLRKHLQAEKERHDSFVYPGNLAAELLGAAKAKPASVMDYADSALRRRSSVWKWVVGFGSVAAAALVLLFLYIDHEPLNLTQPPLANNDNQVDEDIPIAPDITASINDVSSDVPIAPSDIGTLLPEYQSMTFPTIPSVSDLSTTDTANTQPSQEQT